MDIIITKNQRMEKLEKKLQYLEDKIDKNFLMVEESFRSFQNVILNMQEENGELKKDRDFLLEKYKEFLRRFDSYGNLRNKVSENTQLIRDLVLEEINIMPEKKNIDDLFDLVLKKKKINLKSAAKELEMTESRVKYWALKLRKNGSIDINENRGGFELMKK